jgi:thymidylate synthase
MKKYILLILLTVSHIFAFAAQEYTIKTVPNPKTLPQMKINKEVKNIFDFNYEDFELTGYNPHPHIAGKVSV